MVDVYRLSDIGLALSAGDGVVRAGAMAAVAETRDILAAAEARAAAIVADAERQHQAERERGFAEGRAEAARAALADTLAEHVALDAALRRVEDDLAALVVSCVRAIIADADPVKVAQELTRAGLRTMRREKRAQLFVSPELAPALRENLAAITANFPEVELIDVVEDASLAPPSVVLQSGLGKVACVLDDALESLGQMVRETLGDRSALAADPAASRGAIAVNPAFPA